MPDESRRARDAMADLAESWMVLSRPRDGARPGETYLRLPESLRAVLSGLKSDDMRDVRPWWR